MRYNLYALLLLFVAIAACAPPNPSPQPTAQPTSHPTSQPTNYPTIQPSPTPTPIPKPNIGIQGQFIDPNGAVYVAWAADLGVGWIKQQVDWNLIESAPGEYNWSDLDPVIDQAQALGFKILLGVAKAPGFSRSEPIEEDGPPNDFTLFNRFMLALSSRYRGRVAAYELWNEPNLRREWRGHDLSAEQFVELVQQGATGARQGDPNATLISGAPGVTGIDDGIDAIDDRVYLRAMIAAGVAEWVDAIGAHPYGAANPPDERAFDAAHKASGFNNHPSFFFLDTLEDYRAILTEAGIDKPIWITEFGWPSIDAFGQVDTTGWEYAREVSEADQAAYLMRAIQLRRERPWLGPMFVWNLNVAWLLGPGNPQSAYSLVRPDGSLRPAYLHLRNSGE
ncbi:MAG TPA: cellulase family glycosylhydrolase [Anaerolineae bacterium]